MNYEISGKTLEAASEKSCIKVFLLLISSIVFVPAAYVFVAAVFIASVPSSAFNHKAAQDEFVLVALYCVTGVLFSRYRLISSAFAAMFGLCMFSYYLFFSSINAQDLQKAKKLLFMVSIIVFLIGIAQFLSPDFSMPSKWVDAGQFKLSRRIYSTFYNPNVFGFFINFIVIMACEKLDLRNPGMELAAMVLGLVCLFLTFSRTAWISLIASLLAASLFDRKYLKYAAFVSAAIFGSDALLGIGRVSPTRAAGDSSFLYRIEIWKACLNIIRDHFFTGIGFGTLFKHISSYSDAVKPNIEHCHNIYLQVFTETGAIGALVASTLLYRVVCAVLHNIKASRQKETWVTAFAVLSMALIHGTVDSVLLTPQILLLASMYAGAMKRLTIDN
ncbi:MAG: O-antigen ligase family protein [Sedimentibacter sp.]|uniref:O-antigen ligase family protein n=1 Tax=Sedimentibacter sp. TaxID=1960295 RepID=UPI0031589E1F